MQNNRHILLISLVLFSVTALAFMPDKDKVVLTSDGPYIVYDSLGTGAQIITVSPEGRISKEHVGSIPSDYAFNVTTSDNRHTFRVALHNVQRPKWNYEMPKRLFITSDPHANFDCLFDLLHSNGIIDEDCNWTYGDGHLAIIGDVMDRGEDATAIYWLLYKLEAQASSDGGVLHFMMGNHEPLVLMNDNRYTRPKYTTLADSLGVKYNYLLSERSELGKWITSRNTIERIGSNILVHAGLSRTLYDSGLSIAEINALVPEGLYKRKSERNIIGQFVYMLHSSDGPIWYRGLVRTDKKYNPVDDESLDLILKKYGAERIIVGHTIFDDVSMLHNGRVIAVNVDNKENRMKQRSRALLLEEGDTWIIYNDGERKKP